MAKLPIPVSFEWDKGNLDKNFKKHNVTNLEAEEIFRNRPLIIIADAIHSRIERRFIAHGITSKKRNLTIIFTLRKQKIRIISARNQNKRERALYR